MGFDSIVLKNSMSKFGVKRPRGGTFGTWFFVDSLEVMKGKQIKTQFGKCWNSINLFSDAMPYYESKSLNNCMAYYFNESQPTPHSALKDANCVRSLCENYAETLGYDDFDNFLYNNSQYLYPFWITF